MNRPTRCAVAVAALLLGAAPAFAQGVFHTPPSPNSAESMPQPAGSAPSTARTLAPGSTGTARMGGALAARPTAAHKQMAAKSQARS